MSSLIPRNCLPKRPVKVLDTTRILDWDSRLLKKPLNQDISIRNAPSLLMYPSEVKSLRELLFLPKCKEPLSSDVIISITSQNTTDMRRDTEISQSTAPLLSQLKKVISLLLGNAGHLPRLFTLMFSRLSPTKS